MTPEPNPGVLGPVLVRKLLRNGESFEFWKYFTSVDWTGLGGDDCGYPEWCSSQLLSHTDRLVGGSHWISLVNTQGLVEALVTIDVVGDGVERDGRVGELLEREGGGGVDTNTRVVGGDVLATTASQENEYTADNLDNIYIL